MNSLRTNRGFSLVETIVTLAIFSVITAGVFSAFDLQVKTTRRETATGRSEIENNVANSIIDRDLDMAGYGLADDYNGLGTATTPSTPFNPLAYTGVNNFNSTGIDRLFLRGTALGINSRAAQGWSYLVGADTTPGSEWINYATWSDSREDLESGDRVVVMDPSTKTLQFVTGNYWLFKYNGATDFMKVANSAADTVTLDSTDRYLVYGLYGAGVENVEDEDDDANLTPYYTVRYSLGGAAPQYCAENTQSLQRAESRIFNSAGQSRPLLSCVLDFQVAFGLDRDEDGTIDTWDNGGASYLNSYTRENQRKRLKQIRAYILVQSGTRDTTYTYPDAKIHVGEILTAGGVAQTTGREITLTDDQRSYRWQLLTLNHTPRNLQ